MYYPRPGGFRYRLARFFMGRNGPDTLYYVTFALSLLSIFLWGIFASHAVLRVVFFVLYFFFFGYGLFRMLSRNVARRRWENDAFRRGVGKLFMPVRRLFLRVRDRKTHIFRKCPYCKAVLRLRRIPGEHTVRCPQCKDSFSVHVEK